MCVLRAMNKTILSLILVLISISGFGQDNDTASLREAGVIRVEKYLFVHAFIDNHDTCLYYQQQFDKKYRSIYERVNMGCYGYNDIDEFTYSYNGAALNKMIHDKEDGPWTITSYKVDSLNQPIEMHTFYFRSNDSSTTFTEYYKGQHAQPDSSVSVFINQEGDTLISKTIARFNEKSLPVELFSLDQNRNVLQHISYEYRDTLLISAATTMYGEQAGFMQVFYEYDQFGRLVFSYNTVNQRQEYYYLKNGLIKSILNYNPKGELESEIIYKYYKE